MLQPILKLIARAGFPIMCWPPKKLQNHDNTEMLMVLHYCPSCRKHSYEKVIDYVSQNEHFLCSNCGLRHNTRHLIGITLFYWNECSRINELKKKRFALLRAYFGSIKEEDLPPHRDGQTAGELESQAWQQLFHGLTMLAKLTDEMKKFSSRMLS